MALIVVLLLLIIGGTIDYGLALRKSQAMASAAAAAARYGTLLFQNPTTLCSSQLNSTAPLINQYLVEELENAKLDLKSNQIERRIAVEFAAEGGANPNFLSVQIISRRIDCKVHFCLSSLYPLPAQVSQSAFFPASCRRGASPPPPVVYPPPLL